MMSRPVAKSPLVGFSATLYTRGRAGDTILKIVSKLCVVGSVIVLLATQQVSALSNGDLKAIRNNTPFYDPNATAVVCPTGSTVLTGSENVAMTYNYLISKGLSPPQAAGVMGNLAAESGINPRRVQGTLTPAGDKDIMTIDNKTGFGLAQWTSIGRQRALHAAAETANKQDSDIGIQLDHLWGELQDGYKSSTLTPLLAATDVRQASSIFMINFEGPLDQSASAQAERAAKSLEFLTKYGSSTVSTTAGSPVVVTNQCGTGSGGADNLVTGDYGLPVDKKWYDQHPDWFTKPHHDYPAADIPVPLGSLVYSMSDGKIIQAPVGGGCGTGVMVDAGGGVQFLYCHGSDGGSLPGAKNGDVIKAGELIMHSASTGSSTGPHLHVQITINGAKHCPQTFFVGIVDAKIPGLNTLPTSGCTN